MLWISIEQCDAAKSMQMWADKDVSATCFVVLCKVVHVLLHLVGVIYMGPRVRRKSIQHPQDLLGNQESLKTSDQCVIFPCWNLCIEVPFNALELLVEQHEGHAACKNILL